MEKLRVEDLHLSFKGVKAIDGVSFGVQQGEIFAIIGPNGAGKTSVLNCISGFYRPEKGRIFLNGREITTLPPQKRAALGVARTFQNVELYRSGTVVANVLAGRIPRMRWGIVAAGIYWGPKRREEVVHRIKAEEILDFLDLEEYRYRIVRELSYGIQKKVELGRALALEPKLLLLDEIMAGLTVDEKLDMARYILELKEVRKIPIVLIEHDMGVVMDLADRVLVMDYGRVIALGVPKEIREDPTVVQAYLGDG
jgi:branched-chain amino acid transport system ATP-binding protein